MSIQLFDAGTDINEVINSAAPAATLIEGTNNKRAYVYLCNTSTTPGEDIWLNWGSTGAAQYRSILIAAGQAYELGAGRGCTHAALYVKAVAGSPRLCGKICNRV
jgi:hypothetical protein